MIGIAMLARGTELETHARSMFEAAMFSGITPAIFAEWVYIHPDLAKVVGYADEEDLLTFDYQASNSAILLNKLLRVIYAHWWPGPEITRILWRSEVRELAQQMLQHTIHLLPAIDAMVALTFEQEDTLVPPGVFQPFWDFAAEYEYLSEVYYDEDKAPSTTTALTQEYMQFEAQHRPAIEEACQKILDVFSTL